MAIIWTWVHLEIMKNNNKNLEYVFVDFVDEHLRGSRRGKKKSSKNQKLSGHLAGWPNLAKNYNNLVFAFPTPINKIIIYPVLQALVFRGFSSNFIILMGNLSLSLINFTFQISVQFIPSSIITIALMPFFLHLLAGLLQ